MRTVMLGTLIVAGLVVTAAAVTADPREASRQPIVPGQSSRADSQLIALSTCVGEKYQQVTVIDPNSEAISVYHVDLADGKIRLRSVRNIHWDLQMVHLNGATPLPREIQVLLEQP